MLRVVGGQLSYLSPLDYVLLLIYFAGKISFNSSPCGEKKIQFQPKYLRVNVSKNQGKLKKRGHGQKIDCAHTLSV